MGSRFYSMLFGTSNLKRCDKEKISRPPRTRDMDTKIHWWGGRGKNKGELINRCKWGSGYLVCYLEHQTRHILATIIPLGLQELQILMDNILGVGKCDTAHRAMPLGVRAFSMLFWILKLTHFEKLSPPDLLELEILKNI